MRFGERNQTLSARYWATASMLFVALLAQLLVIDRAEGATARIARSVTVSTKTYRLTQPDQKQRLTVGCPGRSLPLGGGMTSDPPPQPGGEGVYPHSYERLGVQHGWHVTAVLFSPDHVVQPHDVTLQVVCAPKLGHVTPPHTTVNLKPGQTKAAVATCPGRRQLFAGGFQRTDFTSRGGDYVTESRAISSKSWRVVGHAFGGFGGQMTAIAYCVHSKRPLLNEVSAMAPLGTGTLATATTPSCPPGQALTSGGFSATSYGSAFFTNGGWNSNGTWSASGFNMFGPSANVTAYGYCLKR